MNQHLQTILTYIGQLTHLNEDEKAALLQSVKDADKDFEINNIQLDHTKEINRTTAILLEDTIEELGQKRKAVEAQNKELEIETALERVRTVAMSMSKADDLLSICEIMHHELKKLGFDDIRNAMIDIHYDEKNYLLNYDYSDESGKTVTKFIYNSHPIVNNLIYHAKHSKDAFTEMIYSGKELEEWRIFRKNNGEKDDARLNKTDALYYYFYSIGTGAIGISMFKTAEEKQLNILRRFRNVFDLAYKRYIDITNAETQAREARIEMALESVRAASLAMHDSNQLKTVATVMFKKLTELGLTLTGAFIFLFDNKTRDLQLWISTKTLSEASDISIPYTSEISKNSIFQDLWNVIEKGEQIFNRAYTGKEKIDYFKHVGKYNSFPQEVKDLHQNAKSWITSIVGEKHAALGFDSWDEQLATAEDFKILKRFSKAFDQAYVRFLDLQKAEAQSREAQIEASLERVRSQAMMMQRSEDLSGAVAIVFNELNKLSTGLIRCGIGILHKDKRTADVYSTTIADNNSTMQVTGDEPMDIHPLLHNAFEAWLQQQDCEYILKGDDLKKYYEALTRVNFKLPHSQSLITADENTCQYYYNAMFVFGGLFAFSDEVITADTKKIMKRFANVFEQTYTRFLDITKAEAQAKEAKIETALERVRSRTLAMQKSDELAETSAVLFKQLISLGIEPHRLYISIMKDDDGESEFWITDEEGSKVSPAYTDNLNANASFKKMFEGWKEGKQSIIIDMHGEELQDYFQHLTSLGVPFKDGLKQKRRIQHIAYFNRGFIGMASPDDQPAETIHLLERFAAVFNLTFTRFNDLKIAEAHALQAEQDLIEIKAARKKAEETLNELQVTQNQLIQKEKMASLGELTAGIAHEIQNPLNFVNNFSEVSKELLSEMRIALENGDKDEADLIANDIIENLEKINYHGKRADAIVKGMLQHSRQTSGTKESTDINALCDEYLRLSYHGLRAKDKSFNADFRTDFDESIGKINIIPQDVGRVLLNLFNNAFYAVNEKSRRLKFDSPQLTDNYKPLVSIHTKKINNKIEISVEDNGNGIPQSIIDKIFQPFFTTKPTGQGTGLGLSLAYDIITKEHNGTIKVESKEGKGTTFIIQLPVASLI